MMEADAGDQKSRDMELTVWTWRASMQDGQQQGWDRLRRRVSRRDGDMLAPRSDMIEPKSCEYSHIYQNTLSATPRKVYLHFVHNAIDGD
jgi:hypothetical protein